MKAEMNLALHEEARRESGLLLALLLTARTLPNDSAPSAELLAVLLRIAAALEKIAKREE